MRWALGHALPRFALGTLFTHSSAVATVERIGRQIRTRSTAQIRLCRGAPRRNRCDTDARVAVIIESDLASVTAEATVAVIGQ